MWWPLLVILPHCVQRCCYINEKIIKYFLTTRNHKIMLFKFVISVIFITSFRAEENVSRNEKVFPTCNRRLGKGLLEERKETHERVYLDLLTDVPDLYGGHATGPWGSVLSTVWSRSCLVVLCLNAIYMCFVDKSLLLYPRH